MTAKFTMKYIPFLVLLALGVSGCAIDQVLTPEPDRTEFYYLKIDSPTVTPEEDEQLAVMIEASRVSDMLKSQQIATLAGEGQLRYSIENVWGEDLEEGIRKVLRAELSAQLKSSQVGIRGRTVEFEEYQSVGYYVEELVGALGEEVKLRVTWWIESEGEKELYTSEYRVGSNGDGYADYVEAIRILLVEWSQEVAGKLGME